MSKIVGILGGMGPLSTIQLMKRIVALTPAKHEQDHIRLLVDNFPQIPDRTEFILGKGPSPLPKLCESAKLLEKWGANFIAIPCNTAHAFINEIQRVVQIDVLDMLNLLKKRVENVWPAGSRIGLIVTSGTIKIQLYQKYLEKYCLIYPDEKIQKYQIMASIYGKGGIKSAGVTEKNRDLVIKGIETLRAENLTSIIAGCTEIELALEAVDIGLPLYNPLEILAENIVKLALS
jgi:aspartate racemase